VPFQENKKTTSPVIIFPLNELEGTVNAPIVDLLRLNTIKGIKTLKVYCARNRSRKKSTGTTSAKQPDYIHKRKF